MTIKRHGLGTGKGSSGRPLPFAKVTEADGWLYVSGQTPMRDGEVMGSGMAGQAPRDRERDTRAGRGRDAARFCASGVGHNLAGGRLQLVQAHEMPHRLGGGLPHLLGAGSSRPW